MKVLTWLNNNLEKTIAATLFILFTALMILNVILRFIFQNSLAWASEAILTIFVWFVWFAISYAFKERAHIRVTAIVGLLPLKAQKVLEIFVSLGMLVFFVIIMKVSVDLLGHFSVKGKTSLLLKYPMWLFYTSAMIGGGLSVIRIYQNAKHDFQELSKG